MAKTRFRRGRNAGALLAFLTLCHAPSARQGEGQAAQQSSPVHIMANAVYFREPTDRDWQIKITGVTPSLSGAYIIVHDVNGKLLYKGVLPHGQHTKEKPWLVRIAADEVVGDYRMMIVGQQDDWLGIDLPVSDLPFEVYGGHWFAVPDSLPMYAFQASPDQTVRAMGSYGGELEIYDENKIIIADTRKTGKVAANETDANFKWFNQREKYIEFPVQAGKTYWMKTHSKYFKTRERSYFAFDPTRLFIPPTKLDEVKYWELPL